MCRVGGIASHYGANIENCYAKGNIMSTYNGASDSHYVGGIVESNNGGNVINCYNISNISGKINDENIDVGGIVWT